MGKQRKRGRPREAVRKSGSRSGSAAPSSPEPDLRELAGRLGSALSAVDSRLNRWLDLAALLVLGIGLAIRLHLANLTYFELDEAYHSYLSMPGFPRLWDSAHSPTHPPLLLFLTHFVQKISFSEPSLRFIPVISGVIFPWFVYRWMGLVWTRTAGFAALVILIFAPMLAHLSSVLRQYTLGLLFLSIAVYWLEIALRRGSAKYMAGFAVSLWLSVISTFPTAFFCLALGVYALVRFREASSRWRLKAIWAFSQVAILGTYVHFLFKQILRHREGHRELVENQQAYFAGMFPVEGIDRVSFVFRGFFDQFRLTFQHDRLAWFGLGFFLLGIALIIHQGRREGWTRSLSYLTLLLVPFVATCAASFTRTYPWGNTRQTIFLVLCIAIAAGVAFDWVLRRRTAAVLLAALLLTPWWVQHAEYNQLRDDDLRLRRHWSAMMDFLHTEAPGARLLIEGHLGMILSHYLAQGNWPIGWYQGETRGNGFRWYGPPAEWEDFDHVWEWLANYQAKHDVPDEEIVYVMDAGWGCQLCRKLDQMKETPFAAGEIQRYGRTAVLIPVRAGYRPPTGGGETASQ